MILKDIASEVNRRLMIKQNASDTPATLSMPEHMFKKISVKLNTILMDIYTENKGTDIRMFDILMSLNPYFDYSYMVDTLLDKKIITLIKNEMKDKIVVKNDKKKNNK